LKKANASNKPNFSNESYIISELSTPMKTDTDKFKP